MEVEKFTLGMGDRFARQGRAQLRAVVQARAARHNLFAHRIQPIFGQP